jgi:hypothetical protein
VLEIALVLLLFGGGFAAIVAFSRWHASTIERFWRAAAGRLNGTLSFKANLVDVTCSLAVVLDGQDITLTRGRKYEVYARAAMNHPTGFELKLYPRPPSWLVDRAKAATTGDAGFDTIFAIETTHGELAQAWLEAPVRDAISRAGHVWLQVRDGSVVGNRSVHAFESDAIDCLARAVAALAVRGRNTP